MAHATEKLVSKEPLEGKPNTYLTVRLNYHKERRLVFAFISVEKHEEGSVSFFPFSSESLKVLEVKRLGAKTLAEAEAALKTEALTAALAAKKKTVLEKNTEHAL